MKAHSSPSASFGPTRPPRRFRRPVRTASTAYHRALGEWDRHQVDCRACLARAMLLCPEGDFLANQVRAGRRRWIDAWQSERAASVRWTARRLARATGFEGGPMPPLRRGPARPRAPAPDPG